MPDEDEKVEETTGESEEENAEEASETAEGAGEEQPEAEPEGEAEAPRKEKKQKKVVRRRKTKRERENPLTTAVRLAVESGKVEFGARSGMAASSKAKLYVTASNTPAETRDKLAKMAKDADIPVIEFEGSSMELGSVCGRPFPVSVLSIFQEGSSNIMELAKKK